MQIMAKNKIYCMAVYLNRDCPRKCIQCGISDKSIKPMSIDKFKEAFDIAHEYLGTEFFLILGNEPLLMKDDFVELIKFFNKRNYFYGLYSTSPQPLFDKYKDKLLNAGLNNWSCGVDALPHHTHVSAVTLKKATEGIEGLKYMAERGAQTFAITTLTNENIYYVPEIITYIQENIPNCVSCVNPIEWAHNETFDFFNPKEEIKDLCVPESKRNQVKFLMEDIKKLTRIKGYKIQNTDANLDSFPLVYDTLNYRCNGRIGMAFDCNGALRRCGYNKGKTINKYSIFDVPNNVDFIYDTWFKDILTCEGCHWSFIQSLEEGRGPVEPESEFYTERWRLEI